jgi:hypothetical protein
MPSHREQSESALPPKAESWVDRGKVADVLAAYAGWHTQVLSIIEAVPLLVGHHICFHVLQPFPYRSVTAPSVFQLAR